MWDSPSVVAGEKGRSSPVPNDLRGRRPHQSGAGLLRPVIPTTCATVSPWQHTIAPKKVYRVASQIAPSPLFVAFRVGFLSDLLVSCVRRVGSSRSLRSRAPPRKMLNTDRVCQCQLTAGIMGCISDRNPPLFPKLLLTRLCENPHTTISEAIEKRRRPSTAEAA